MFLALFQIALDGDIRKVGHHVGNDFEGKDSETGQTVCSRFMSGATWLGIMGASD